MVAAFCCIEGEVKMWYYVSDKSEVVRETNTMKKILVVLGRGRPKGNTRQ